MIIGIPKEIKTTKNRVAYFTSGSFHSLVEAGHEVS